MSKKSYNTIATFQFFNNVEFSSFDETFESIRFKCFNLMTRHGVKYTEWVTILNLKTKLYESWNYEFKNQGAPFYFKRVWLDNVVREFSNMLWISIFNHYYKNWFHNNVPLPVIRELPKKQQNPESICSFLADKAVFELEEMFR